MKEQRASGKRGADGSSSADAGAIRLAGVCKRFGNTVALDHVDLEVPLGHTTVLMGPSGGGKTTLLRLLLGLERPDAGTVEGLEGLRPSAVFQEDRLCENLTVMANVCLPHKMPRGPERDELCGHVRQMLVAVGLAGCERHPVRTLSGGMKRRVAILRAVLADFDLIAFDEPLKGLDPSTKDSVMGAIGPLLAGKTTIWVTHDTDDLGYFPGARVVRM